ATRSPSASVRCTPGASWAYARGVGAATRSRKDVWGDRLRLEIDLTVPRAPEHARLRLRLPAGTLLGAVRLGAQRLSVDRSTFTLVLPRAGRLHLLATLRSRSARA